MLVHAENTAGWSTSLYVRPYNDLQMWLSRTCGCKLFVSMSFVVRVGGAAGVPRRWRWSILCTQTWSVVAQPDLGSHVVDELARVLVTEEATISNSGMNLGRIEIDRIYNARRTAPVPSRAMSCPPDVFGMCFRTPRDSATQLNGATLEHSRFLPSFQTEASVV